MKFEDMDVVTVITDFPERNVKKGDTGTVVAVFRSPDEAYEVEFVDSDGETRAMFAIRPENLERAQSTQRKKVG